MVYAYEGGISRYEESPSRIYSFSLDLFELGHHSDTYRSIILPPADLSETMGTDDTRMISLLPENPLLI